MVGFYVNAFSGMSPVIKPRLLDGKMSQKAVNVRLTSGGLEPINGHLRIGNQLLSKAGVKLTIYRFGQDRDDSGYWFHWTNRVNVVRGSIADDTVEHTYYTGDGVPKYTFAPVAVTGGGTAYPYGFYNLGVPKPDLITTTVTVSNRQIASATRSGRVVTINTVKPHNLISDSSPVIIGATEAVYNGIHKVNVISANVFNYTLPSDPVANPSGTLSFNFGGLPESIVYAVTYVDSNGKEGAPSILSGILSVIAGQEVTFTGLPTAITGAYSLVKKRIYRTASGSSSATLRFVGEVNLATSTFVDDVVGVNLGENIPSLEYEVPPSNLEGLISFSNGMLAGISDNQVCISVPYQPHAWPISSRYSFNVDPVALGSFGQSIVVLTKGMPSVLTGSSNDNMTQDEVKFGQPCLSNRSVVEVGGGVMWASDEGLAFISNSGFQLATVQRLSANEWKEYNPSSIHAYRWENRYVGFYTNGNVQGGFVFDVQTLDFYELDFYATAGFTDPRNGNLYLAIGNDVYLFDAGTPLTAKWKSKLFNATRPINIGYAKVEAEAYPLHFTLFADGKQIMRKQVFNNGIFTLPSGYRAIHFEFNIETNKPVYGVGMAETSRELRMAVE